MTAKVKVGSIRSVAQRLKAEGYETSEYTLRILVKRGMIPAVWAGNKALISFDKVAAVLEGCTPSPDTAA